MKKTISLLIALSCLWGCNGWNLKGELDVHQEMTLVDKKGNEVPLAPGIYTAYLNVHSKKGVKLKLQQGNWKENFTFSTPPGEKLPPLGEFSLTSADSGQAYDLKANITQEVTRSPIINRTRPCNPMDYRYEDPYYYYLDYPPGWNWNSSGSQEVSYQERTDILEGEVIFLSVDDAAQPMAVFNGERSSVEIHYLHRGPCISTYYNPYDPFYPYPYYPYY